MLLNAQPSPSVWNGADQPSHGHKSPIAALPGMFMQTGMQGSTDCSGRKRVSG